MGSNGRAGDPDIAGARPIAAPVPQRGGRGETDAGGHSGLSGQTGKNGEKTGVP